LIAIAALFVVACRPNPFCGTQLCIYVTGENPPTFSFSPTFFSEVRSLGGIFFVAELQRNAAGVIEHKTIWRIEQNGTADPLPSFKYGELPRGFQQTVPAAGQPPPSLLENRVYLANGAEVQIGYGGTHFIITDGKAKAQSAIIADR
jgi:hypothetical protein